MKTHFKIAFGIAVLAATAATHGATTSTTMAVSATVPVQCSVTANALNFGTISDASSKTQTSTISVICGNGVPYTVAINGGQNQSGPTQNRRMANGTGGFILYDLRRSATGTVWGDQGFGDTITAAPVNNTGNGSAQVLTAHGATSAGTLPPPGSYSDLLTVTVHF